MLDVGGFLISIIACAMHVHSGGAVEHQFNTGEEY